MKNTIFTAVLCAAALSSTPALAESPAGEGKDAQASQAAPPNVAEFDKQTAQVQENWKKMQEQMDKIRQTTDPQERQKLLQEHWATMQSNMQLMHGMRGPGMLGGPMMGRHMTGGPMMGWRDAGGYYSKLTPEQAKQRQYMMDQYMGMQQMMMDHMMQHQQYMWMGPRQP